MLGYRKGTDGQPEIVPEEAEIIRRIYRRYLAGCSLGQIKQELEQSAMGLSRDKITVRVYKGYIGKGHKEPDPLRAG